MVAEPRAVDVGDTIALGVGEAWPRREGQVSAETIGGRQARPLSYQPHNHACPKNGADLIAQCDPRARCDHGIADFDSLDSQSWNEVPDEFDRVSIDRRRRQAIADDDGKLARAAAMACQQVLRSLVERSPEVGPP